MRYAEIQPLWSALQIAGSKTSRCNECHDRVNGDTSLLVLIVDHCAGGEALVLCCVSHNPIALVFIPLTCQWLLDSHRGRCSVRGHVVPHNKWVFVYSPCSVPNPTKTQVTLNGVNSCACQLRCCGLLGNWGRNPPTQTTTHTTHTGSEVDDR